MPLYEYRCKTCGYRFEKIQKISDTPETACSKCGGELFRPLTAPALQFKGAGWYVNDYASKSSGGSSSDKSSSDKSSADSSGSSEAKPAAESKPASTEAKPTSTPGGSGSSS